LRCLLATRRQLEKFLSFACMKNIPQTRRMDKSLEVEFDRTDCKVKFSRP